MRTEYQQVYLTRGTTSQVVWIPADLAHHKFLKIRGQDGWRVVARFAKSMSFERLHSVERNCRAQFGSLR